MKNMKDKIPRSITFCESMKVLWKRLITKTPSFFKRVKLIGGSLGATALLVHTTYGDRVPVYMDRWLEYCIVAGIVAMFVAQLPVDNPEDLK